MQHANQQLLLAELKPLIETTSQAHLTFQSRAGTQSMATLNAQLDRALAKRTLPERQEQLVRGLILLWHEHFDAAHSLAQEIEDADGSLLHAIIHRREPDYSNAKYWLRHAGHHPVYSAIASTAAPLLQTKAPELARDLLPNNTWNPLAFVDACERAEFGRSPHEPLLMELQRIECIRFLEYLSR